LKKLTALIFLLAICAQTFSQGFFYIDYIINKAAFEKECVNKAKSWLHCNGQCVLAKKIIESEKKQQSNPEMKLAAKTEVLSSKSFYTTQLPKGYTLLNNFCIVFNTGNPVDQPSFFFHPPGASC